MRMAREIFTDIKVTLKPGYEDEVCKYPQVKGKVSHLAGGIADQANALGSGFRTGYWHDPKTHEKKGGTAPVYASEKARETAEGCVAIVHPANYAAMKDNHLHNTLLKAMRG